MHRVPLLPVRVFGARWLVQGEVMKAPKTIGEAADRLFKTKLKRLDAQKVVDELAKEEAALKEFIINELPKSNAAGVTGKLARVTVSNKSTPQVKDWDAFNAYVKKHNAFELLQRRLSVAAVEERLEAGVNLPGVEVFFYPHVSINKV